MPQILMIAHYMSGDRNTLASALHLDPSTLVCVYGPLSDARTDDLYKYFLAKFKNTPKKVRVVQLPVPDRPTTERITLAVKRPKDHLTLLGLVQTDLALLFGIEKDTLVLNPPTVGTGIVADRFGKKPIDARASLVGFWGMPGLAKDFDEFLRRLGFSDSGKYVFLWCKTGDMRAEKAHHYTDPVTWGRFAASLDRTPWVPVMVGDDIGIRTRVSLTRFWDAWFQFSGKKMERDVQLAFWVHIAGKYKTNCCSIGMRSGMLEVPSLVGIRTLYMEEMENAQQTRMAQWLGKVDTWYRAVLSQPLGLPQLAYSLRDIETSLAHSPRAFPDSVALHGGNVRSVIAKLEEDVKKLIDLVIYRALERSPPIDKPAFRKIADIVFGYVDMDIQDVRYAMSAPSVESIIGWVENPRDMLLVQARREAVAEAVLQSGVIAIRGMGELAARRRPVQDRTERKVQYLALMKPKPSASGGSESTALTLYVAPQRVNHLAPPLQAFGGAGGPHVQWRGPPLPSPLGLRSDTMMDKLMDKAEYDQLHVVLRTLGGCSPAYFQVYARLVHLARKHGF